MMLRKFLATTAMAVGVAGAVQAQDCPTDLPLVEPGKLTMSINATLPPIQYIDEKGELQGLNREIGDEVAKRLCLDPVYMNVSFEVQIPGLASNRWDMINTGLFYTPERAKIMQLIPIRVVALALIAQGGNPLGISKPEDLAGHPVGVEIAGAEEKQLRALNDEQVAKGMEPMDIRVFNNYGDAFLALGRGTGRCDLRRRQHRRLLPEARTVLDGRYRAAARHRHDAGHRRGQAGRGGRRRPERNARRRHLRPAHGGQRRDQGRSWKDWSGKFEIPLHPGHLMRRSLNWNRGLGPCPP